LPAQTPPAFFQGPSARAFCAALVRAFQGPSAGVRAGHERRVKRPVGSVDSAMHRDLSRGARPASRRLWHTLPPVAGRNLRPVGPRFRARGLGRTPAVTACSDTGYTESGPPGRSLREGPGLSEIRALSGARVECAQRLFRAFSEG
jgi:hypothetical protein